MPRPLLALLLLVPLLAAGCLVSSTNKTEENGVRVSAATLEQIEPGTTSEQWLLATLGEPTSRTAIDGRPGVQMLRYDYSRTEKSAGAVLFIFGGASEKSTSSRAFFEVTNGIVTKYWTEA